MEGLSALVRLSPVGEAERESAVGGRSAIVDVRLGLLLKSKTGEDMVFFASFASERPRTAHISP